MIAFGVSVAEGAAYRAYAEPGIELAKEPDSEVYVFAAVGQMARTYNLLLDAAQRHADLEAFVLVHPHAELTDPALCAKVRQALRDPEVAVIGPAGASRVRSMAWWEGDVSVGSVVHSYQEFGGGELPAYSWTDVGAAGREVDAVDGFVMVFSPWAVQNVRFDEALATGHGWEVDYCLQVRAAGKRVVTADIAVKEHKSLELVEDSLIWIEAHIQLAEKWEGRLPGDRDGHEPTEEEWKRRARRAEAEREAARSLAYGSALGLDARVLVLQREMQLTTGSLSWRMTEPLRRFNLWRNERRARRLP